MGERQSALVLGRKEARSTRSTQHSPSLETTTERSELNEVGSGGHLDYRVLDDEGMLCESRLTEEGAVLYATRFS